MRTMLRAPRLATLALLAVTVAACGGGGGGGGSDNNDNVPIETATATPAATVTEAVPTPTPTSKGADHTQEIVVDPGPTGTYVNGLFTTVTVCMPGTATCEAIDHVLVDSGSSGLRIVASTLTLTLPTQTDPGGAQVAECFPFLDSFTWGPVHVADIVLAGETAPSVPVQIIGEPAFPAPPDGCTSSGLSARSGPRASSGSASSARTAATSARRAPARAATSTSAAPPRAAPRSCSRSTRSSRTRSG